MDVLDQSDDLYLILVSRGSVTKAFSNFGKEEIPILKDWIIHRHVDQIIRDQIKIIQKE